MYRPAVLVVAPFFISEIKTDPLVTGFLVAAL
jgi:hypothetical protein